MLALGNKEGDRHDPPKLPFPAHFPRLSNVAFVSDPINPEAQAQKAGAGPHGLSGQVM